VTRAFLAVKPPPEVLDAIAARLEPIGMPGARRTPRDQWHYTVQFLGNDADIDVVTSAFEREPLAAGAADVRIGGADAIGRRRRARILYLGLHDGEDWMRVVAEQVAARLGPLGYPRDDESKDFLAHLTIGRFREPTDLRPLCAQIGDEPVGPPWRADEVVLYESELTSEGAKHTERARIPVGG
jgi:RNA 2',3'-cyclic 3'-phosphodiesterase